MYEPSIPKSYCIYFLLSLLIFTACNTASETGFNENFDNIHDRIWISENFWSIPLEDWQVSGGRLECMGHRTRMRVNLLTHTLSPVGNFFIKVRMGMLNEGKVDGSAGLSIGIHDTVDQRVSALCYFGKGMDAGIHTEGYIFLGDKREKLPDDFNLEEFSIELNGLQLPDETYELWIQATDAKGISSPVVLLPQSSSLEGLIALVNTHQNGNAYQNGPRFWFDDLNVSGTSIKENKQERMGPILWSMHTLSKDILKMTAQMPPIGEQDNQQVMLQIQEENDWKTIATESIDADARTALFRMENWDSSKDIPYRLVYEQAFPDGTVIPDYYQGTIRKDPIDRPLKVAGLTCQFGSGFPYTPVSENLIQEDPDLLFFSGDQLYESNGGYGIIRFPADSAILNYLGKWYMFGWAFRDLMRDRPTVCTPDDHDVFQGNLWGEGGENIDIETFRQFQGSSGGYVQPAQMVNAVHRTQCVHLPDPYDPTLLEQDITPWYTDMVYGRVSFAIISDRMFKTGPVAIATWGGRPDHLQEPLDNMSRIDNPNLEYLGPRQMVFLEDWVSDWKGADMKVLLSQTLFAGVATHHGEERMVLAADLDSGGWPQNQRQQVIGLIRKGFAFHINGDQHLPAILQYGLEDFGDAGWAFCTPAITVGYPRAFWPDKLGWSFEYRPDHDLPNTGYYKDGFGHPNLIYTVGNPKENPDASNRYDLMHQKASGYGMIHFDQSQQTIKMEAYRYLDAPGQDKPEQFPGWPLTINVTDNYGREAMDYLPTMNLSGIENPIVEVIHEATGELVYKLRINRDSFQPKIFESGAYTIKVGDPDTDSWKELTGVFPDKESSIDIAF